MSPPPAQTPSPHRFIVKKGAPPKRTPLAQEHVPRRPSFNAPPSSAQQFSSTPRPSTQQFNATPKFNYSSTPRLTQEPPTSTPTSTRYATPVRPVPRFHEAIQNSSDESARNSQDSIEPDDGEAPTDYGPGLEEDDYAINAPSLKRRRLSPSLAPTEHNNDNDDQDTSSSSLPVLSSPPAPRHAFSSTAPRFKLATQAPSSTPQPTLTQQSTFAKAPRFRPPDPSSQAQPNSEPLPEQFSPHRRGQKYVAGGLAAEVREWLVNLDTTIPSTNAGLQHRDRNAWTVRVCVDEISGGGRAVMTLIRGRQIHAQAGGSGGAADVVFGNPSMVRVALAGEGAATGLQKGSKPEIGSVVAIKGPLWEIVIENEKWGVGVDWKVL
ncbi:hypothetical protein PVAG01_03503 [Phlyctema vagabunda]|uniref:Uncharacterized protein n=1 Tax=Phlyctema vagabunda TaxID=108571 RepID=A0ABR4PMA5_9HELO